MELAPFAETQTSALTRAHDRFRKMIPPRRRDTPARHKGAAPNTLFVLECKTNEDTRQPSGLTRAHRLSVRDAPRFRYLRQDRPPGDRERDRTGDIDWRCLRDARKVGVQGVSEVLHGRAHSRARGPSETPFQPDGRWQGRVANDA